MNTQKLCQSCGTPLAADAPQGLCPACLMKVAMATATDLGGKTPRFTPPTVAELAPQFPQLEILEFIGQGGMGAVYKARQKELDRIVALKILPPGIGHDAAFAERFTREARALAKLNHPGIVTIHDFGRVDYAAGTTPDASRLYYFLMEFVDGVNLRQLLSASRVSTREALAIVPQICDALQFAHDQGIVHRDIKPENILLDRRGRVKVADFGLAKIVAAVCDRRDSDDDVIRQSQTAATENLTDASKVMGTPQYMSPEQIQAPGEVDHRADIYALGVVFYQMLTGELPGKKLEAPSSKVQIDVRLDAIVLRALEKNPNLRYQQVSQVKTMVETIVATPPGSSGRESAQTESGNQKPEEEPGHFFPPNTPLPLPATSYGSGLGNLSWWWIGLGFPGAFLAIDLFGGDRLSDYPNSDHFWFSLAMTAMFALLKLNFQVRNKRMAGKNPPSSSRRESAQTENPEIPSRFSRTAIVGAGCLGLVVALVFAEPIARQISLPIVPVWRNVYCGFFPFFQIVFEICGTILGWIAVSQIRRSAGKIRGLWLAVFDGLLFPLLALDAGILFFLAGLLRFIFADSLPVLGLSFVTLVAIIPLNWLIIRRVWRAVNLSGAGAPATGTPGQTKSNGWEYSLFGNSLLGDSRFTSADVREISAHMTEAEKLATKKSGTWFGIWNSATFLLPMSCLFFIPIPVPLNWIIASMVLLVGLAFYPLWWRRMANEVCATAWAKERGYNPATLRIFPFGSTGIMLLGVVWLAVVSVCWWRTYQPEGVWLPWLSQASLKEAGGGTSIRVTEVSQQGQSVLVRIICDKVPRGGELTPVFAGPLIELPYKLPAVVTNVDCLLMPAPHTYDGKTLAGTNVLSGKTSFLLGFMLPDDQAAAAAVKQVQKLNLGKLHGLNSPLFVLRRSLGKDINGKPIYQEIVCWIGMQAKSVANKPKPAAAPKLAFGPVVERVMNDMNAGTNNLLNLASGRVSSFPDSIVDYRSSAAASWYRNHGIDVMGRTQNSPLLGREMIAHRVPAEWWDYLTTKQLDNFLTQSKHELAPLETDLDYVDSATFLFKTREGFVGLLQNTGYTENPRGVKFRYKRVQSSESHSPWVLREPRKFNELQNVGTETAEAAAETVLWAAQSKATNLLEYISLPPELLEKTKKNGLSGVLTRQLADKILLMAGAVAKDGFQSVWIDRDLDTWSNPITNQTTATFTATDEKGRYTYYGVVDFKLCGRSNISDPESERFTTFIFANINRTWRLIIPGMSPELLPPGKMLVQKKPESTTNPFLVKTCVATSTTDLHWGKDTAITGGWKIADGNRVFFVAAVLQAETTNHVPSPVIMGKFLQVTESASQRLGLDKLYTDNLSVFSDDTLTAEQYRTISAALRNSAGIKVLVEVNGELKDGQMVRNSCELNDGRMSRNASAGPIPDVGGQKYFTGWSVDYIPNISKDGKTVRLVMVVQLNDPSPAQTKQTNDLSTALANPPNLQFLAWQDEWQTKQPGAVRHPDGSPVTDAEEIKWLKAVPSGDLGLTKLKLKPEPRILHLWFSHPNFRQWGFYEVRLSDDAGKIIKLGGDGSTSSGAQDASDENGNRGWNYWALSPGAGTNIPPRLNVCLRYTIGALERTQEISPYFSGMMSLEGRSQLNAVGQNVLGRAFVAIAVDAKKLQGRQFDVVAITKDGRELPHTGWGRAGPVDDGVRVENFDFTIPLTDVAKFIIGTRPVRTMEWKNVVLPK